MKEKEREPTTVSVSTIRFKEQISHSGTLSGTLGGSARKTLLGISSHL
jgi:hypothetical protein